MMQRHYLAIKYKAGADLDVEMGTALGHRVRDRWYHWHGPSYMGWSSTAEIVTDYGMIDSKDDAALDAVEVRFAREFPWKHGIRAGSGWLAPDGTFYPCRSWEHDSCIHFVSLMTYGHTLPPSEGYSLVDKMEHLGWTKLYNDLFVVRDFQTLSQPQIDTLGELLMLEEQDEGLMRSIRHYMQNGR